MESQYASQLMGIILSWDYWDIESKLAQGEGPIAHLPTIPKHFATPEVRQRAIHMWHVTRPSCVCDKQARGSCSRAPCKSKVPVAFAGRLRLPMIGRL